MPSDYDGEFFLDNVRYALRAREEMAWGRDVPEDLFRHFVLPVRVNNERLDEFRMIYYDTLRRRVAPAAPKHPKSQPMRSSSKAR